MLQLKDNHVDEILAVIFTVLLFLVGLSWNSLIDTAILLYGNGDSLELAFLYAIFITLFAFIFGDYVINRLKIQMEDQSTYMHRLIKMVEHK